MPPRRAAVIEPDFIDPVEEVIRDQRSNTASDLAEALESFQGVDQGNVKGILYKTNRGGGKYEWIREVYPPFDHNEIFTDLQKRFGGGDFQLRMMVSGKIATNINFSIVFDPSATARSAEKSESNEMLPILMQMMNQSKSDMMTMMMALNAANQQSSDRMMQMMTVLLPAMMGNQTKISDLVPLLTHDKGGGMKDAVETMVAMKGLLANPEAKEGFNADDMVGSIVRAAGPIAGAVGKAFSGNRGGSVHEPETPQLEGGAQPLRLPHNPAPPSGNEPETTNQILRLIRPDVLYFFGRRHAPDMAADAVYDVIIRAGISDEELNATFAPYAFSDDKWNALAAEGIDLRADIAWAEEFIAELAKLFMGGETDGDADDQSGAGGSPPDVDDHGEAGAKG